MQEVLVILVVIGALAYLGNRLYRSIFTSKSACDVNCGCEASAKSPVLEQLKNKK